MTSSVWPMHLATSEAQQKINDAKVLMVGAGGIGCELLKTLVLSGFRNITLVDLDTIDTSNLNRQFLFRKKHVGQSKATVAADSVRAFCPEAKIEPFCDNIKDPKYNTDYFSKFTVVLNGLDNLDARRHVNRLCLAADKPLVESGTAGYLGQVSVHIPSVFECFECQAKPVPKSFPICTIRNTPDKPIHCIVWAKELLFQRLFGRVEGVTDLDTVQNEENGPEAEAQANQTDPSQFVRTDGESSADYAKRIFKLVFQTDMERLLSIEDLWKTRAKPKCLVVEDILPSYEPEAISGGDKGSASGLVGLKNHHKVWNLEENARVFLEAIRVFHETRGAEVGDAVFDKDDPLAVDFVTAASNLRSLAYNIPAQSSFDAKGMAGNIIHAIATTNAIISGLITTEAMKLVTDFQSLARTTFLLQHANGGNRLLQPSSCQPPNPKCPVCGKARLYLTINTAETTFEQFISKVLKKQLSMIAPSIRTDGGLGYEEGDDLEDDERDAYRRLLPKALAELPGGGIQSDTVIDVDDFGQHFEVKIIVKHKEDWDEEKEPDGFELKGDVPAAVAEEADAKGKAPIQPEEDDDIVEVVEDGPKPAAAKRPRDSNGDSEAGPSSKQRRTVSDDDVPLEVVEGAAEDEDGVIHLD